MSRKKPVPDVKSSLLESPPHVQRLSCYKRTLDDWAPSYRLAYPHELTPIEDLPPERRLVEVNLSKLSNNLTRVSVWGGDDTGMELDFDGEFEARAVWLTVLSLDNVSKSELTRLGFKRA